MERKIRMVFLDGLLAEDLLKLKAGGFFDGVAMSMPSEAKGQEAMFKVPTSPVVFPPVAAVPVAEDVPPVVTEQTPAKAKKTKVEEPKPEPVPTPAEVIQQTKEVEQQEPVAEPKGNGKKLAAKNARQNARYIVTAFSKKWTATFIARTKGGLAFQLDGKDAPVLLEDGAIVEEMDAPAKVAPDEVSADDVDLSVETLTTFTKLRDLIHYAHSCGIPAEGMAAFCEGVKADVPLLSRISNIADRVQRTLEVMGLVK